ncbi:hypothetical protein NL676_033201 [Syzygium grande]|nr:hypothetical protein NL676_033201 [Syzygium grande]
MIKIPKTHHGPSISSRPSRTFSRVRIPPSTKSPEQPRASKMGSSSPPDAEDPLAGNYGEVPLPELQSKQEEAVGEPYTEVDALAEGMKGRSVLVRGRAQAITAAVAAAIVLDAGIEIDPLDHLSVEVERKLGQLVLEKPFNTIPCYDDPAYSNSFNVFLRGGQIISGTQRVHDCELLTNRAEACGTKVRPVKYTSSLFRQGAPPHGGFRAALELVATYFLGPDNVDTVVLLDMILLLTDNRKSSAQENNSERSRATYKWSRHIEFSRSNFDLKLASLRSDLKHVNEYLAQRREG